MLDLSKLDPKVAALAALLLDRALIGTPIVYTPVGRLLGLNLTNVIHRGIFGDQLETVGDWSMDTLGIALPSLVVAKKTYWPTGATQLASAGPTGFWAWAQRHGLTSDNPAVDLIDMQRVCHKVVVALAYS